MPVCPCEHARLTDSGVVADLDEVVEFRLGPDDGLARRSPIDAGVRADLAIVFDDGDADVIQTIDLAAMRLEAETVAADDGPCEENHSIADTAITVDDGAGVEAAVLADGCASTNDDVRPDHRSFADDRARFDHRKRSDGCRRRDLRRRVDHRRRVNARLRCLRWVKQKQRAPERPSRVFVAQHGASVFDRCVWQDDDRRRLRLTDDVRVAITLEERDVARPGFLEPGRPANFDVFPFDAPPARLGDVGEADRSHAHEKSLSRGGGSRWDLGELPDGVAERRNVEATHRASLRSPNSMRRLIGRRSPHSLIVG